MAGIPQGNSLSPLLSNLFLADFDQELLNNNLGLVRYADDIIVMCKNKNEAINAFNLCRSLLRKKDLDIYELDGPPNSKVSKIIIPPQEPLDFLSVCFDGKVLWPSKSTYCSLKNKLRDLGSSFNKDTISIRELLTSFELLLRGWIGAFYYTDVERYFSKIDDDINNYLAVSLRKRHWSLRKLDNNKLSIDQRKFSGVPYCEEILSKLRKNNNTEPSAEDSIKLFKNENGIWEID